MGCGGGETKEESSGGEAASPSPAAEPIDTANAATITGKVAYTGAKPVMRNLDMSSQPSCARQHQTPPKSEEVVVNGEEVRWYGLLRRLQREYADVKSGSYPQDENERIVLRVRGERHDVMRVVEALRRAKLP